MKNYTILIVDDDFQSLKTIFTYLQEIDENYQIIKTNRAEKAFKIAINKNPDLIITDWEMPDMSGLQLIKALGKNKITKDIPVIMVTGIMLSTEDLKESFESGAVDYITKPVIKNELNARVNSVLKLVDSFNKIKQLTNATDNLIKMIAHDMQGSFSGIINLGKLLSENFNQYTEEKIKKFLLIMSEGAEKSYQLFDKLLKWALTQTDEIVFNPQNLSLEKIFLNIEKKCNDRTEDKNIKLVFLSESNSSIYADENMLMSILQNLINNAIKFSHKGSSIQIKTIKKESSTEISVIDEGVGISLEDQKKLFKIDSIKTTYGTDNEKGAGIGLILCKEFINKHGGTISSEKNNNKGSRFYFTLPNKS